MAHKDVVYRFDTLEERIYQILRDGKMNQAAVARAAGFSPKAFNDMLRGRKVIKPEYIQPICKSLRVSPNDLFGHSHDKGA